MLHKSVLLPIEKDDISPLFSSSDVSIEESENEMDNVADNFSPVAECH